MTVKDLKSADENTPTLNWSPRKNFNLPESLASLRFVPIHLHLLNVWLPRGNVSTEIFNRMRTFKTEIILSLFKEPT